MHAVGVDVIFVDARISRRTQESSRDVSFRGSTPSHERHTDELFIIRVYNGQPEDEEDRICRLMMMMIIRDRERKEERKRRVWQMDSVQHFGRIKWAGAMDSHSLTGLWVPT